jgi:hypothetical protein
MSNVHMKSRRAAHVRLLRYSEETSPAGAGGDVRRWGRPVGGLGVSDSKVPPHGCGRNSVGDEHVLLRFWMWRPVHLSECGCTIPCTPPVP